MPSLLNGNYFLQFDFCDFLPKKLSKNLQNLCENLRNDVIQRCDSLKLYDDVLEIETFIQRLHTTVCSKMRNKLIELFDQFDFKSEDFCVICVLLIVLEIYGLRNFDHIDEEREQFNQILPEIKVKVFKKLQKHYRDSPLISWSFWLMLFYYKFVSRFFNVMVTNALTDDFIDHENFIIDQTVPDTIKTLIFSFDCVNFQRKSYLKKFIDILCDKVDLVPSICDCRYFLEDFECIDIKTWSVNDLKLDLKTSSENYSELCEKLQLSENTNFVEILQSISNVNSNKLAWPLYHKAFLLSKPILDSLKKDSIDMKSERYAAALLSSIKIWQKSINDSYIAEYPDSFNWIVTFSDITFEFAEAIKLLTQAIIIFQSIHRQAVLNAPYWYITLITDIIIGIINHLEIEFLTGETNTVELDSVCSKLISSVGRTLTALRPNDPRTKLELAHPAKNAIEVILIRVADANGDGDKNLYKTRPSLLHLKRKRSVAVVRSSVNRALNQFILIPFVKACDKFSLAQSKISLKPASANALLTNLVKEVDGAPANISSGRVVEPINVISRIGIGYKFSKKSRVK